MPNFDKFRKKLFLIIGGGIALIVFLVWAIVFAPQATVTITAKTNLINIAQMLQLKPNATLDTAQHILPASVQQTKKTTSVDFEATGTKDVGDKATGNVKFSTNQIDKLGTTIPAGTPLTASNGLTYLTDASVTLTLSNYSNAPTTVTAAESGSKYNGANGSVSGAPNGINASLTDVTAGGTDKTVTVVSDADIAKAKEQLQSQDANTIKTELKKQFESGTIVIDESFKADSADPTSTPKVGEQVSGKAKLTAETTYTLVGVKRSDLKANFEGYLKAQLTGKENQKVYTSGDDAVRFSQFIAGDGFYTVKVSAEAQVGPKIDDAALKPQLVGKRAGEIQQQLSVIEGVENVDTNFSPFWVTTAPSADKITIKFLLKNDAN